MAQVLVLQIGKSFEALSLSASFDLQLLTTSTTTASTVYSIRHQLHRTSDERRCRAGSWPEESRVRPAGALEGGILEVLWCVLERVPPR